MERSLLLATAALAALAIGGAAHAHTAAADASFAPQSSAPGDKASATNNGQIAEIVVTAQKRSENLSKVPLSITAITGDQLQSTASKTLEELQGVVPGVTIPKQTAYGGSTIVIRGTSGQGTFLEDDPVAVYVDGIYQASNSRFGVSDLADVQSVEIVRGPQGTLQGRNATAGAILVRTTDPGHEFGGYIRASVATPGEYRTEGAVTIPLSNTLSLRLAGDHFAQRGFAYNESTGDHIGGQISTNLRAILKWTLSNFWARLAVNYQELINKPAAARWGYSTVNPTGQAITVATPYVPLPQSLQDHFLDNNVALNISSRNTQKSPNATLEMHYDFGAVELVSLTGVSWATNKGRSDSDGLGTVGTNGVSLVDSVTGQLRNAYNMGDIKGNQQTQELRLQSNGSDRFKWLIGLYGSHAFDEFKFDIYNLKLTVPINQIIGFRANQTSYSGAAFADATFKLTDNLSVLGGVRNTKESKLFTNSFSITNYDSGVRFVGPVPFNPPRTSWNDLSYRGGVNYQATNDIFLYVNYSKGFKSGGFNAFGVGTQPAFNPEKLYSWEAGAKAYFWNRRGYVAISGYTNRYQNLQVTVGVPTGGLIVQNAANAKIKGFEVEWQLKPTDQLTLSGNAAYTDAYYSKFTNAGAVDGRLIDATGNRLPNTPKWQYYLQADYAFDVGSSWQGKLDLSWRWRDTVYFFGTNQNPNLSGRPDGELGARIDFTDRASNWSFGIFGRNLNNRRVVANEQVQFAYPVAFFNEPRVVGLVIGKKF